VDVQNHWDKIYKEKAPSAVSWYRPHIETSLPLIRRVASKQSANIDVGVDDLLMDGFRNITALDISQDAIEKDKEWLGNDAKRARWLAADITKKELADAAYDV